MFSATTRAIRVEVEPHYLDDQSDPDEDYYVWAYTVVIRNEGVEPVQLKSRHWQITDQRGYTHEVHGEGVVGEQPVIPPGESFQYTSGTPLTTPSGIMVGNYEMALDGGDSFEVDIPAFSLDCPHAVRLVN